MLLAWEGDSPRPNDDSNWATWLEAATGRVMRCNPRLAKEKKRLRAQVKAHAKKVQLAEAHI